MVNLIEHKFCHASSPECSPAKAPSPRPATFPLRMRSTLPTPIGSSERPRKTACYVLLYPIYLGYMGTDEGWVEETLANGPEKCLNYGRYLGKRYKDFDNIIWMMGGDRHPGPALEDVDMVALGIKEYDQRHVFSAHCDPEHSAVDDFSGGRWLDFNTTYTYGIVHAKLLQDYNRTPAMPFHPDRVQLRRRA